MSGSSSVMAVPRDYPITLRGRRIVVLISMELDRPGGRRDRVRLTEVFRSLGFIVHSHVNISGDLVTSVVEKTTQEKKIEMLIFVVMAHGSGDSFRAGDNSFVDIKSSIIQPFEAVPAFCGKPKVFMFNCCRGSEQAPPAAQAGTALTTLNLPSFADGDGSKDGHLSPRGLTMSDFVIVWATMPGHVAWRDAEDGSWFVSTLVDVIYELSSEYDLTCIIHEVSRRLIAKSVHRGQAVQMVANGVQGRIFFTQRKRDMVTKVGEEQRAKAGKSQSAAKLAALSEARAQRWISHSRQDDKVQDEELREQLKELRPEMLLKMIVSQLRATNLRFRLPTKGHKSDLIKALVDARDKSLLEFQRPHSNSRSPRSSSRKLPAIRRLMEVTGFDDEKCRLAMLATCGDIDLAAEHLLLEASSSSASASGVITIED